MAAWEVLVMHAQAPCSLCCPVMQLLKEPDKLIKAKADLFNS